ncbi:HAD family hydrolase [Chloroflexota bacterium]
MRADPRIARAGQTVSDPAWVILDLDGTLFNTQTVTVPAVQRALGEHGLVPPAPHEIKYYIGATLGDYHGWLRSLCGPSEATTLVPLVDRYELALISTEGKLYPGVRRVLVQLHESGHRLAICSNGPAAYVHEVLSTQDIEGFFEVVRVPRSSQESKVRMVGELRDTISSGPAVIVGDRQDDIEAAHQNELPAIATAYGYGSAAERRLADAVAESPPDLPDLIRRFVGQSGLIVASTAEHSSSPTAVTQSH